MFALDTNVCIHHLAGYKFYGSPTLRDARPVLETPLILDHCNPAARGGCE